MDNLPTPILGDVTAITIGTTDLEKSLAFYQRLGFAEVVRYDQPFPWIQITDTQLLIMLRKHDAPLIALSYYVKEMDRVVAYVESQGIAFDGPPADFGFIKRYIIRSPDGLAISLVTHVDEFQRPTGKTMLTMDQRDFMNPEAYANKISGMYGEFAHSVADLEASLAWWEKLGFTKVSKFTSPYPWAIVSDGLAVVGLHQAPEEYTPMITYFASDMKEKVAALIAGGLTNYKEIGGAGNIVCSTPEGQKFALFSMGM